MNDGDQMIQWMKDLWNFPRSLTGHGTRQTLMYLKSINPNLYIHSYDSGTKVFDWNIPDEWNINDAYFEHESGKRFAELSKNNLHILGYSTPCDKQVTLEELLPHIHTLPEQPDLIPYVTSYYSDRWGFCLSENEKQQLPAGNYRVFIDALKGPGKLELADLLIKGKTHKEIFFSTYVCHPSMANNELSGPVLSSAIVQYIQTKYRNPKYSYRFLFVPETIGSITYMSDHLQTLQENIICGFNLSCVGDERAYSYVESRLGNTLADHAIKSALIDLDNVLPYSFLERGSDERQYCAPGIDLPLCGFSRSKYGEYPEYHTSADNFDLVTSSGLTGSLEVMKSIIDAFEIGLYPKVNIKGEPQLGKRGLYPTISKKGLGSADIHTRFDFLAYSDGNHSLFDIAYKIKKNLGRVISEALLLQNHNLISLSDAPQKTN